MKIDFVMWKFHTTELNAFSKSNKKKTMHHNHVNELNWRNSRRFKTPNKLSAEHQNIFFKIKFI